MRESNRKSKYWLSPGVDVPARSKLREMAEPRKLDGLYIDWLSEEALFIPPDQLMRADNLVRLDIAGDLIGDLEQVRTHAFVSYFRELRSPSSNITIAHDIAAFRGVYECMRIIWPPDLDEVLLLDQQYRLFGSSDEACPQMQSPHCCQWICRRWWLKTHGSMRSPDGCFQRPLTRRLSVRSWIFNRTKI